MDMFVNETEQNEQACEVKSLRFTSLQLKINVHLQSGQVLD